ncbi:MAG: hypothetical protein ACI9IV_001798 [Paracoccaceae bacterium]|jgi:hypothetical protein|tara:strand:+ start:234 stop:416 length:183 start_codon:yes stop_codon:yes gene_type:complete
MVSLFCAPLKPFGHAVPLYLHLTHDLIAIYGIDGGIDPDFRLLNIHLDRPVELFSLSYYR